VAKHFIGKQGAGSLLRLTYMVCDNCLRDIIASAPAEFLPVSEAKPIDPIERLKEIKMLLEAGVVGKEEFLDEFMPHITKWAGEEDMQDPPPPEVMNIRLDESEIAQIPVQPTTLQLPETKEYTCKYCGEKADSPPKLAAHVRRCPMKNGGGSNENGG
jgi:hypothetical protein